MDIVNKSREYAFKAHEESNHKYDDKPYSFHLEMVYNTALKFIYLIKLEERDNILSGCYVHDCIEDARQTYNDVVKNTNVEVAEIAFALTNEKGKTRKDRANKKYYDGIKANDSFVFVKICDRIANVSHSKNTNSKMIEAYKKEFQSFKDNLYSEKYKPMWDYLEELLS